MAAMDNNVRAKEDQRESFLFQSDINQLMSLIINAFYKNKDVCFREIISNASDANEKYRYQVLHTGSSMDPASLNIRVIPDYATKTLTIADNGVGMSKEDLIHCLGTIAKSGTKEFVQTLLQSKKEGDASSTIDQIGQFGVGFYSAYLIADKVSVVTKKDGHPAYLWESDASGSFTITPVDGEDVERGTRVCLHLKSDQHSFLEKKTLTDLIKKHSEFIPFPIMLMVEKEIEVEEENENDEAVPAEQEGVTEEKEDKDKEKKAKKKTTVRELEHINKQKPIWTLPPSEVTHEQYADFYKTISNDWNEHLAVKHFNVEGSIDMKALLYLPKQIQFDMHEGMTNPKNIGLYVKKVFITDDSKELIPPYLCFIRGVVDCEDLPLNISREFLQNNKVVRMVQKNIVKKAIEMMTELAENKPEEYMSFYAEFARFLKHGVHDDAANRQKLESLLRYKTTRTDTWRSLSEYVQDMLPEQKGIFYMSGESEDLMRVSPVVEYLKEKKCEVIFMTEPIDEYVMQNITEYQGKRFICVTKNVDLFEESEEEKKKKTEEKDSYKPFCEAIKKSLEKTDTLTKVDIDERVSKSEPFMVTTDAFGITANVERLLKAQSRGKAENGFLQMSRKNLLINPGHKLVQELFKQFQQDPTKMNMDLVSLMYQSALLTSGYALPNPRDFTQTIYRIVGAGMNVEEDDDNGDAPLEIDLTQNKNHTESSPINEVD